MSSERATDPESDLKWMTYIDMKAGKEEQDESHSSKGRLM